MPVVELRVDHNLICSNFDGYKLSFEPVPVLRDDLDVQPSRLEPNSNQYSLLHVELFGRQNLLVADPWQRHNTYFVNARHQVLESVYHAQSGRSGGQRVVYTMEMRDHGDGSAHIAGDYNYSLCFISERFCVICDGINTYHLLDTGDRSRPSGNQWQLVTRTPVDKESGNRGYIMYDARLDVIQERKQISLVAGHISRRSTGAARQADTQAAHQPSLVSYIDLAWGIWTLDTDTNQWEYKICQRLETTGYLQYCAFEPRAESLILASNRKIETRAQREADEDAATAVVDASTQNGHDAAAGGEEPFTYTWTQSNKDVFVRFPLPENASSDKISVTTTMTSVEVSYLKQLLLAGRLYLPIDAENKSYLMEGNALHLTLPKSKPHVKWPQLLLEGDVDDADADGDEGQSDAELAIPNIEDPIEDCDLGDLDDDNKMVRFNLPAGEITHTIYLGNNPLLFVTDLRPGFPAAFATRQDVDASVWLQVYQPSRPQEWGVRHEGQMHAFGYVQASKEQRKFTACCPEFGYTVICESRRHVLIYRTRHDTAGGLRKRNGPPVVVGKQHLVNLDEDVGDILGIATASDVIIILTETALLHLQM